MNIAIVGSRDYADRDQINAYVDSLPPETVIVSGGARGVDSWAVERAKKRKMSVRVLNADWDTYGKAAGMIRNSEIVAQSDRVVAFWDGESRGTQNTMHKAQKAGKLARVFKAGESIDPE